MYTEPMVTIELKEYQDLRQKLEELTTERKAEGLLPEEQAEATGMLMMTALSNPGLFREGLATYPLRNKYRAHITKKVQMGTEPYVLITFSRIES